MPKLTLDSKSVDAAFQNSKIIARNTYYSLRVTAPKSESGKLLVISSKKTGNAVTRNLIKRRLKSIFSQKKIYLLNRDVIIICNKQITTLAFQDLTNQLSKDLQKFYPTDSNISINA